MLGRIQRGLLGQGQGGKLTEAARLLARRDLYIPGQDDDEEPDTTVRDALAAFGLVAEDAGPITAPEEVFVLWPECLPAFNLFQACATQWRHGPSGPTGLDYAGVRCTAAFRRIPRADREAVFEDVCTMERAWLIAMSQRNSG